MFTKSLLYARMQNKLCSVLDWVKFNEALRPITMRLYAFISGGHLIFMSIKKIIYIYIHNITLFLFIRKKQNIIYIFLKKTRHILIFISMLLSL